MFDTPEGMTYADFSRHPVRYVLRAAAAGGKHGLPSKAELDALQIPSSARARVRDQARTLASIHDEGRHQDAWTRADEYAVEVIESLPDELRDPDYLEQRVALDPTLGPDELANLVSRIGGLRS